jgi:hypothetical protein
MCRPMKEHDFHSRKLRNPNSKWLVKIKKAVTLIVSVHYRILICALRVNGNISFDVNINYFLLPVISVAGAALDHDLYLPRTNLRAFIETTTTKIYLKILGNQLFPRSIQNWLITQPNLQPDRLYILLRQGPSWSILCQSSLRTRIKPVQNINGARRKKGNTYVWFLISKAVSYLASTCSAILIILHPLIHRLNLPHMISFVTMNKCIPPSTQISQTGQLTPHTFHHPNRHRGLSYHC